MFCSGSRHARPPGAASTSADGRFTPMVSNLLKRGILVPYIRHWKHCTLLFKFRGPYHRLGEGPPTMGRWTTFGANTPKIGGPFRQWHWKASNWYKRVPAMMPYNLGNGSRQEGYKDVCSGTRCHFVLAKRRGDTCRKGLSCGIC